MKKKRLYILAPNDRFNYGDLLFPHVLTYYLKKNFDDVVYVSTSKSNLSDKGGIPTEPYSVLFNVDSAWENHLIVAGGESLCVRWSTILAYIDKKVDLLDRVAWKLKKYIGPVAFDIKNTLVDVFYHTKTRFVFSVGKNELPQFESIVYNALGGSGLLNSNVLQSKKTHDILSSVDFISVRDEDTSLALERANIKHRICPDSAILMSDVFPEEKLLGGLTVSKSKFQDKRYIFFQGNLHIWKNKYEIAAHQLEELHKKTQAIICLCPIGTALGHCDDIALSKIAKYITDKDAFILVETPNIFDIMWLIKHSCMYVGTSLHGIITSMSFNVPYVGYGGRKQIAYIEKWSNHKMKTAQYDNFYDAAIQNLKENENSDKQKEIVEQNFEEFSILYR